MNLDDAWLYQKSQSVSFSWRFRSKITITIVGSLSKLWIEWLNKVNVYNRKALDQAVGKRQRNQGLITVANHYSCLDEPLLWGVLELKNLINLDRIRWSTASHDVCFTKYWHAMFFTLGKTIPVVRGIGVYQRSMDFVIDKLNDGKWIHIFPEGKVNLEKEYLRFKWGVGRLVSESKITPLVLPIYHLGMDDVLPNKSPYIPQVLKTVTYVVGDPMDFSSDVKTLLSSKKSPREIRKHITDKIQEEMYKLRKKAEELHKETKS